MADYRDDDGFVFPSCMIAEIANLGVSPLDADAFLNAGVTVNAIRCKSKSTRKVYRWNDRQGVERFGNNVLNSDFEMFADDFSAARVSPGFSGPTSWGSFLVDPDSLIDGEAAWAFLERECGLTRPQPQVAGQAATGALDTASEESMLRKRGPKPQYEWGVFHDALMERIFDNDGLFPLQADDERWAADWFESRYGKSPGESEIRKHVKETRDRFLELRRPKKQGK